MTEVERKAFALHARLPGFARKVERALLVLTTAKEQGRQPYAAFSGGKDSTVMLDLVRRVFPEAPAVFADDEWHLPETLAVLPQIPNLTRVAGQRTHASWFTAWVEGPANLPPGVVWIDAMQHGSRMGTWARQHDCDTACIGIRADENSYRRKHVRAFGELFYAKSRDFWHCYPVAWWSLSDIWAYIVSRDLPYNQAYDRMSALGVPLPSQRVGPLAVERVLGYGQMAILKRGWPDLYRRFVARYPEASAYV